MHPLVFDTLLFETPVLALLSLLQCGEGMEGESLTLDTGLGRLSFDKAELETRRGMIPLLSFDFRSEDDGKWSFYYYGSVSPWKFHRVDFSVPGLPLTSMTFSDVSRRYVDFKAGYGFKSVAGGDELQLACGSLYLWRSCLGLKKVFDEDTAKYFAKMQTTSRHKWEAVSVVESEDRVSEIWRTEVAAGDMKGDAITVRLQDGIIVGIDR